MLLSVSLSLGLPATVACLCVFVRKDTPWDAKVPVDDPSMQLQRLNVSMLQGNCLFGSLKSRKLVEGLFVRVCAPTEECRGTCPRRSATNHAVACFRLVHKHTQKNTRTQPQGAQERAVCLHHSTGCRQGWTPSSGHGGGAVLHNTQTNVASYPLHRSYSDTVLGVVIQPTLLATAAPNLKTSSSHRALIQNVCLQGLKGVYL